MDCLHSILFSLLRSKHIDLDFNLEFLFNSTELPGSVTSLNDDQLYVPCHYGGGAVGRPIN